MTNKPITAETPKMLITNTDTMLPQRSQVPEDTLYTSIYMNFKHRQNQIIYNDRNQNDGDCLKKSIDCQYE